MAQVAFALTNAVIGLGNIGAGIGFDVAEKKKMDELDSKANKLKDDATAAGNLYDNVYYVVAINLDRVKKALDKLPSDMMEKVDEKISSDIKSSNTEDAIKTLAKMIGYGKQTVKVLTNLVKVVLYFREQKAEGEETVEPIENTFELVPLGGDEAPIIPESESSIQKTPKIDNLMTGLNIAGIVFGVAGLATTIGLGVWTLEKLEKAISDVEEKQKQVDEFQTAMTRVLNQIMIDAELKEKNHDALTAMAATWKKMSENFDSYEKSMYYAIRGYFQNKSHDEIIAIVEKEGDPNTPFPEGGYPLAKTLAEDIKNLLEKKKTDKEVVAYFATENPKISHRFVVSEYFISTLRS